MYKGLMSFSIALSAISSMYAMEHHSVDIYRDNLNTYFAAKAAYNNALSDSFLRDNLNAYASIVQEYGDRSEAFVRGHDNPTFSALVYAARAEKMAFDAYATDEYPALVVFADQKFEKTKRIYNKQHTAGLCKCQPPIYFRKK